jgi:extracellular factor (EF) 3-hydroxypalmitic acid methyl ester biosynthesis protein
MFETMSEEKPLFEAQLITGKEKIAIDVKYSSKYSVLIRFNNGKRFKDGYEFSKLWLRVNGEFVKLGPCRFNLNSGNNGFNGRLTFIRDVYDFKSLFFDKKIVKLQSAFFNLPLVLAHKDTIKQSFKEFTAGLTYDLNVYKNLFDQLDHEFSHEPKDVQQEVQRAILDTEGRKFMTFLDEKLHELNGLVRGFSADEHERHGYYFRRQLWNIILLSPIMIRTNVKPRGYAGDSEMMRMIYKNEYQGDSTFARLLHKHPMEHPAAQAVRTRRRLISSMLTNLNDGAKISPKHKINVLSVACGPVFEMNDILTSKKECEKYHFTFLDQDTLALKEAKEVINEIENRLNTKIDVDYLNDSVRTMLATQQLSEKWGQYEFIYSMGLFDYLTPPAAKAVIMKLYQLLKPGGEMVIGNFHISNPSKIYMEYWLDWVLYYRTEDEFGDLLRGAKSAKVSVFFENTGSQMFLHVRKNEHVN